MPFNLESILVTVYIPPLTSQLHRAIGDWSVVFFSQIMEWTDDNVFDTDFTYWSPVFHLSTALGER
jgi:hypothetical protein